MVLLLFGRFEVKNTNISLDENIKILMDQGVKLNEIDLLNLLQIYYFQEHSHCVHERNLLPQYFFLYYTFFIK